MRVNLATRKKACVSGPREAGDLVIATAGGILDQHGEVLPAACRATIILLDAVGFGLHSRILHSHSAILAAHSPKKQLAAVAAVDFVYTESHRQPPRKLPKDQAC